MTLKETPNGLNVTQEDYKGTQSNYDTRHGAAVSLQPKPQVQIGPCGGAEPRAQVMVTCSIVPEKAAKERPGSCKMDTMEDR
ncbi:hypothetical protein EYF80_019555 [Liparis tanakae]|uniref:Uncharacterized protein n=1 Tax=Liparis tanakae TaxID=230148 RepID=A0A4Z2HYW1_9TELE|nr:hypothetical protein EYF80_019555 [Liparis tanakae]